MELKFTGRESKLVLLGKLTLFATVYGFILINYIDVVPKEWAPGYHLWLIAMYFTPFVIFSILHPEDWEITVSLGLYSSLMNDLLYGIWLYLIYNIDLKRYYWLQLVPQNIPLSWSLDFYYIKIPVYSWMVALSIYARMIIIYLLLRKWWFEMETVRGKE